MSLTTKDDHETSTDEKNHKNFVLEINKCISWGFYEASLFRTEQIEQRFD